MAQRPLSHGTLTVHGALLGHALACLADVEALGPLDDTGQELLAQHARLLQMTQAALFDVAHADDAEQARVIDEQVRELERAAIAYRARCRVVRRLTLVPPYSPTGDDGDAHGAA